LIIAFADWLVVFAPRHRPSVPEARPDLLVRGSPSAEQAQHVRASPGSLWHFAAASFSHEGNKHASVSRESPGSNVVPALLPKTERRSWDGATRRRRPGNASERESPRSTKSPPAVNDVPQQGGDPTVRPVPRGNAALCPSWGTSAAQLTPEPSATCLRPARGGLANGGDRAAASTSRENRAPSTIQHSMIQARRRHAHAQRPSPGRPREPAEPVADSYPV